MFSVEYTLMQHTSMSTTAQEYSEVVKVDINGIPADLYIGNETSPEKALIWVDEANQVVFNIREISATRTGVHSAIPYFVDSYKIIKSCNYGVQKHPLSPF